VAVVDALKTMANSKTLCQRQAEFCSLFGHPLRIRVMLELGDTEKSAGELAETLGVSQANLSQHFRLMKDRRALRCRKEGKMVFYRITSPLFLQAIRLVRQGVVEAEATQDEE